jgi:site-specific DNA recombinase
MRLRCAAYARYSSDRQSPASIEDQLRKCREFAEGNGWQFLEAHVYTDEALSGAGADRPGLGRLLEAVSQSQRSLDVLLVDDTSRLYRNLGDCMKFMERLNFIGIRVVSVSQGIDTESEQADVLMTVHSLVDSLYIKELAKKTHRGLEGCAIKGLHTGGRCFGYDNIREGESVRLRVNETEAAIVRRIFELSADGCSLKTIAKTLNQEHIPSPRPRSGKQYATWCLTAVREMLRRELYVGLSIWNRSRFIKQPGTNKRVRRERPRTEWRIVERPELRIINERLWDRVQARLAWAAQTFGPGSRPGLRHRSSTSPNLLTGFLKCGVCAANLVIVTGRGNAGHPRYGCPQNFYRGACSNALKERADWIEERLFSALQNAVLHPAAIEYALGEFERQLEASFSDLDNKIGRMHQRSEQIQEELRNLVSIVASCGPTSALVEAINSREQELKEITRQLLGTGLDSVSAHVSEARQFVTERLGNIRQLLTADVQRAKAELAKHVSGIRMMPQQAGRKGHYVADGEWNLLGGYGQQDAPEYVRMVAGDGFEPPTFGL